MSDIKAAACYSGDIRHIRFLSVYVVAVAVAGYDSQLLMTQTMT